MISLPKVPLFLNEFLALISAIILQEVDPCEDITDEDIRMAIQNATGPKGALFVPEVSSNGVHICGDRNLFLCLISGFLLDS